MHWVRLFCGELVTLRDEAVAASGAVDEFVLTAEMAVPVMSIPSLPVTACPLNDPGSDGQPFLRAVT